MAQARQEGVEYGGKNITPKGADTPKLNVRKAPMVYGIPPKSEPETKYVYVNNGGGGGSSAPSYSGPDVEDIVGKIKDLFNQQKEASDKQWKSWYEQQLAQNQQASVNNERQINLNRELGRNFLTRGAGAGPRDAYSMIGPMTKLSSKWQSDLNANRQNKTNNDQSALQQYQSGLANNAQTLAQGWISNILPVYTNRQRYLDDYAYNPAYYL